MLIRTHLAITLCAILILISKVEHQVIFVIVALVATFLPDIDTAYSKLGKNKIFRPLQFFVKHRGIVHSFLLLILIALFFSMFFPTLALGFFLGYGLHLLTDSFTVTGIQPFYPLKEKISGRIKTGKRSEIMVFVFFILVDLFLLVGKFVNVF